MVNFKMEVTYTDCPPATMDEINGMAMKIKNAFIDACGQATEPIHVTEIQDGVVIEDRIIEPNEADSKDPFVSISTRVNSVEAP